MSGAGRTARRLSLCAMLVALGCALLYVGALLDVLDLSVAAAVSFLSLFAVRELPRRDGWLVYAATALLSLLLLPVKTPAVLYALFGGWYPLVRPWLARLPRVASLLLKLLLFNAALTLYLFLSVKLLGMEAEALWVLIVLYAVGNPAFVLYDILLARCLALYELRLRPRIEQYLL